MAKYKYATWMAALILGLGIVGYSPVKEAVQATPPVNKHLTLVIYKDKNYASDVYDNTYAAVQVTVEKIQGDKRHIVYDTTYDARLLKDFPSAEQAYLQEVTIPDVFANKEQVVVSYVLTYYSQGSRLQVQDGSVLEGEHEQVNIGM